MATKDIIRDRMMDALGPMIVMAAEQIITVEVIQKGADEIRDQALRLLDEADAPPYVKALLVHVVETFAEALKVPDFDEPPANTAAARR